MGAVGCRNPIGWVTRAAEAAVASASPVCWRSPMLVSALYIVIYRLLELIVLVGRCDRTKNSRAPPRAFDPSSAGQPAAVRVARPRAACGVQPDVATPLVERLPGAAGDAPALAAQAGRAHRRSAGRPSRHPRPLGTDRVAAAGSGQRPRRVQLARCWHRRARSAGCDPPRRLGDTGRALAATRQPPLGGLSG